MSFQKQLFRSATSIGANIEEATAAQTKRDFISKCPIASTEARESKYWLRLLKECKLVECNFSLHVNEVNEIFIILTAIVKTSQEKLRKEH